MPFIVLLSMAKRLMDENQQPSVTQGLGRLFPIIRRGGRRGKNCELLRVGAGEHLLQQLIQIMPVLEHDLPQNRRLGKYGDQKQYQRNHRKLSHIKQPQEKLPVNLLFFPV